MSKADFRFTSRFAKLRYEFMALRVSMYTLYRINRLYKAIERKLPKGFTVNGEWGGPDYEVLYRSIIYTLFIANVSSILTIANLEKLPIAFNYIDAKLILRSVFERCITQKYILTDPKRLSLMYTAWGSIEAKRYQSAREMLEDKDEDSLAARMDWIDEWSDYHESEYEDAVERWKKLAGTDRDINKVKSWSGLPISEMARLTGLSDLYKTIYRETSWYSHGLVFVADHFLETWPENEGETLQYSVSTPSIRKVECYLQAENLLNLSLKIVEEPLGWNMKQTIEELNEKGSPSLAWIPQLLRLYTF